MKLLLDTNVLIDYLIQREGHYQAARTLCIASYFGDVELWVSVQSFTDASYILRKFMPTQQLHSIMLASLEFFRPCGILADDLMPGLKAGWPDLEDYLIAACAANVDADYLVTRDAGGFASSKTTVISPKEAVALLEEKGLCYTEFDGNVNLEGATD